MAKISVHPILRKDKLGADNKAPICLRITQFRRSIQRSTGIRIDPKYWNSKSRRLSRRCPNYPALRAHLESLRLEAEAAALSASSLEEVTAILDGEQSWFTDYLESYLEYLSDADRYWDAKKFACLRTKLSECFGDRIAWGDLNSASLERFYGHLRRVRKNNPNTARKELCRLRAVVNRAVKEGVISPDDDPFRSFEMPALKEVQRRRLTMKEVRALECVQLESGSLEKYARDAYLLALYCLGIRFGDTIRLRLSNFSGGRLKYRMMKTGKLVSVKPPTLAIRLLQRLEPAASQRQGHFLFPFLSEADERDDIRLRKKISSANARVNTALKRVAVKAGIDPDGFSFHTARHSFADLARQQGAQSHEIKDALRHSSLAETEQYLASFDQEAVDALADSLWDEPSIEQEHPTSKNDTNGDEQLSLDLE